MDTGFSIVHRLTASELAAGLGVGLSGGFIEIVNAGGIPTGVMYLTGVSGAPPQQLTGAETRSRIATTNIAQWSAVYDVDGIYCSPADNASLTTCGTLVGVAGNTAAPGGVVQLITQGDIVGYAGLGVGSVFLGSSGSLTSTPPTTGVLLKLGYVPASDVFVVNVETPIVFS